MTRKNPPARYTLPADPQPADSRCYQVNVPNDPMHIAAFQGQIKALASAYTWQNDDDHTALLAAEAWKPVFDGICLSPDPCGVTTPGILCISGSFADDSYGYVPALGVNCSADYVPGTGFTSCFDSVVGQDVIQLIRPFNAATFIRSFEYTFTGTALASYTATATFFLAGNQVFQQQATFSAGGGGSLGGDVNQSVDLVLIELNHLTVSHNADLILQTMSLCYTGAFPLSQSQTWEIDIPFGIDDGGFVPVVTGGVTYAHYTGSEWYSGCEGCNSSTYAQLQIYRTFTATGPFSVTLVTCYYDCAAGVTLQTATSAIGTGASGTSQIVETVPENPLSDPSFGSGALRLILTNNPQTSIQRIHLTRVHLIGTGVKPS